MSDDVNALLLDIDRLHRHAPALVASFDGHVDPERLPGELALVGQHIRGLRIGSWKFDLLGEGMVVDVGLPVNGPPTTYRPVLDTLGNGTFFVHVDQASGRTGAVHCFTHDCDIEYAAPSFLAFLNRAVTAAAAALPVALARLGNEHAETGTTETTLTSVFDEEFADNRFLDRRDIVFPVAAPDVSHDDPVLQRIVHEHPQGYLADLRAVRAPAFVPFADLFDAWPVGHTRITRYCDGLVLVAHPRSSTPHS